MRRKHFPLRRSVKEAKVYENSKDSLKINEVVHIYGILEHTRLGSSAFHDECMQDGKGSEPVPRVHALFIRRLKHNNPLVIDCSVSLSSIIDDIKAVRQNIMKLLTSCLHCDEAVAQYTLLHLISSRLLAESPYPTTLPALNLICIATSTGLIPDTSSDAEPMEVQTECDLSLELWSRLHEIVPKLVTQLATVDLTLDSLNNGPCLMPIRDPSKGVLDAGRLQVPDGTQVGSEFSPFQLVLFGLGSLILSNFRISPGNLCITLASFVKVDCTFV
ncbi:unnamed protein product [Echinostoma caproni]|uniref:Mini-chromosome maintenance complex-binding protein n=1 Tax=Echinostoma caproni TaxID=27848 RepID=A0A183B6G8_9TREM|nr:unnamed protein product [Echinostoma caproni]